MNSTHSLVLVLALLVLGSVGLSGQNFTLQNQAPFDSVLSGEYRGSLVDAQGMRHQLVVRIMAFLDGRCEGSYDVPDQQIVARRFTSASCENGRVLLVVETADASFEGTHDRQTNSIEGIWSQQRSTSPIRLTKTVSSVRSQEPGANVPYTSTPIIANNRISGIALNGTLITPPGTKRWPIIVFVSDKGTQDRDATDQTGHRPFLVMADFFARNGWASLRMDDREVASTSETPTTLDDRVIDLVSAVDRIKNEKSIDGSRVVFLGHGEGGLIAIRAATQRSANVSALVLASTPAVRGEVLLPAMITASEKLYGTDDEVITEAVSLVRLWLKIVQTTQMNDELVQRIGTATDSVLAEHAELLLRYPMALRLTQPDREAYIKENLLPMLRHYAQLNPGPIIATMSKPSLILVAERDAAVPSSLNLAAWQSMNLPRQSDVRSVIGVNHGFQSCSECTIEEAERSRETVKPEVLTDIIEWLNRLDAK